MADVLGLFSTLSLKEDKIWPKENWPAIRFKSGLKIGSEGGHGPIGYKVIDYDPRSGYVEFQFQKPQGFYGIHKFEMKALSETSTEVNHTIDMNTSIFGSLQWITGVRWLHDALIKDAFDKLENQLSNTAKKSEWNVWVKVLRWIVNA